MKKQRELEELRDRYRHGNFYPSRNIDKANWDEDARIIQLSRRSKKQFVVSARKNIKDGTIEGIKETEISPAEMLAFFLNSICGV